MESIENVIRGAYELGALATSEEGARSTCCAAEALAGPDLRIDAGRHRPHSGRRRLDPRAPGHRSARPRRRAHLRLARRRRVVDHASGLGDRAGQPTSCCSFSIEASADQLGVLFLAATAPARRRRARAGSRAPRGRRGSRRDGRAGRESPRRRLRRRAPARRSGRAASKHSSQPISGSAGPRSRPSACLRSGRSITAPPAVVERQAAVVQMPAQLAARVVQGLVERAARRAEPLGEDVDRHAVQRQRDEHAPLVRRQHLGDRLLHRREELALLGLLVGLEAGAREQAPVLRLERHLAALPGAPAELDRRLEQGELVGPGREAARAAEVV